MNLICGEEIIESDNDAGIVETLCVGYDDNFNLMVVLEHTDYEHQHRSNRKAAMVSKEDAYVLARRIGVAMTELPHAIADAFSDYPDRMCASLSDVKSCFSEALARLQYEKCRYHIVRL